MASKVKLSQFVFKTSSKVILREWGSFNPDKQNQKITVQKLCVFLKRVFEVSKDQLQMDIDDDVDFMSIVQDYLQETNQLHKQYFTYQQAVKLLNWAIQTTCEDELNARTIQSSQQNNNQQKHTKKQYNLSQQITVYQNDNIKQAIGYQEQSQTQSTKNKYKNLNYSHFAYNHLDWGEAYDDNRYKRKFHNEINSQVRASNQISSQNLQKISQKVSIKRSLVKINAQKYKLKMNRQKSPNITFDDLNARQIKYIKKQKLLIKNKKPKAKFQHQKMGLKELFRFYCNLHSQLSHKKKKSSNKGTFDQISSQSSQLYLHNFMLMCKDFSIIQTKLSNPNKPKAQTERNEQNLDVWDLDRLSNKFKKQANYSLYIEYEKFFGMMKTILNNFIFNDGFKQSTNDEEEEFQNIEDHRNQRIQQAHKIIQKICEYFKVDTQENFKETMNRLKVQYKIVGPEFLEQKSRSKKLVGELNGQFKGSLQQELKNRQLQKQKQRIQVKKRYFNKYSASDPDIYSSFKSANNIVNNTNSIYGSVPTSNLSNPKKLAVDQDLMTLRRNISQDYLGNSQIGTILKEARRQVMDDKQNSLKGETSKLSRSKFNPFEEQDEKISYGILHKRLIGETKTHRPKMKNKSKDILFNRIGCLQEDGLLDKYFYQEKMVHRSQDSK